jgi:predicted PhzF superfamily epimerase YddE/YHI9
VDTGVGSHIVTTDSTTGKFPEDYITRLFAPVEGIDEDHVCGSANCIMAPYWAGQKGVTELKVRQVSRRGGELRVGVYGDNIRLRGQVKVTSVGRLFL